MVPHKLDISFYLMSYKIRRISMGGYRGGGWIGWISTPLIRVLRIENMNILKKIKERI
jgi:hypothetical protein